MRERTGSTPPPPMEDAHTDGGVAPAPERGGARLRLVRTGEQPKVNLRAPRLLRPEVNPLTGERFLTDQEWKEQQPMWD